MKWREIKEKKKKKSFQATPTTLKCSEIRGPNLEQHSGINEDLYC